MSDPTLVPDHNTGIWALVITGAFGLAGKAIHAKWTAHKERAPKPKQTEGHSILNSILETKALVESLAGNYQDLRVQLARMEERQIAQVDTVKEIKGDIGELHTRISDHVEKFHSKAA